VKRQKKKEKIKMKGNGQDNDSSRAGAEHTSSDLPLKKRRLVNGEELIFRRPGDSSDEDPEEATGQLSKKDENDVSGFRSNLIVEEID